MDFLDPQKQRKDMIRLITGYVLIGIAVLFATLILLYQAYGFGLGKDGQVIQNGLVYMSSQPANAQIYLDNKLYKANTNTKLQLQAGQYNTELRRSGYDSWRRIITVEGGSLQHFDYPLLFPTKLVTTPIKSYAVTPGFASQSPDRRWLVVQQEASPLDFDLYDLADPKKVTTSVTPLTLPDTLITSPRSGQHGWKLVEWSTDNRHILLQHTYGGTVSGSEYIMFDRQDPFESVNLTRTLQLTPTRQLTLHDKKFDHYYVYDTALHTLGTTSIDDAGKMTPLIDQVLAYKSYGSDMVLYITDKNAPVGQVYSELLDGADQTYQIRDHAAAGPYLIDLAQYNGDWYVAVGASGDNKVYVYKNPQQIRKASLTAALVPVQIMRMTAPNYLAFSSNTQFVMVENGTAFADYDALADKGYNFVSKLPLDPPAEHATWMDGDRLTYVSGDKLVVFDYDNINARTLMPASAQYLPFFNRNYDAVYSLVPAVSTGTVPATGMTLTGTSLLTPADQ